MLWRRMLFRIFILPHGFEPDLTRLVLWCRMHKCMSNLHGNLASTNGCRRTVLALVASSTRISSCSGSKFSGCCVAVA